MPEAPVDRIRQLFRGTLVETLGMRVLEASAARVLLEMPTSAATSTTGGALHGGAIMALADTCGAIGAFLALPADAKSTTTLESKTNFFAAGRGGLVRAEAVPLHAGRRTSCWQTRVTDAGGRLLAQTIQTQMVLE